MFTLIICALLLSSTIDVVQSKFVYQSGDKRQFLQQKVIATWWEAKERCEKIGATLASPTDEDILKFMQTHIALNNYSTPYFIGMKVAYNPEPTFVSVEGEALDDMPQSALDLIEQLDPRDGSCLSIDSKSIRVVECWERLPYICYTNEVPTTEAPTAPTHITPKTTLTSTKKPTTTTKLTTEANPGANCKGRGYRYYQSVGCYKIHIRGSMWNEANKTCTDEGAYLVILDDEKEAKEIIRIFGDRFGTSAAWVGLRDEEGNGDWRTVKGEPLRDKYNVWADYTEYEVQNIVVAYQHAHGKYASLTNNGRLSQYSLFYVFSSICEKDV